MSGDVELNNAIIPTEQETVIILSEGVYATRTGLIFTNGISYDEWESVGEKVQKIEASVHWWIGDWLNFGECKWGEKYSQALKETGLSYETVKQDKWVAGQFELCERSHNLDWTHHLYLADKELTKEDRRALIMQAEQGEWTTREMRHRVKEHKRAKLIEARKVDGELPIDVSVAHGDFREIMAGMPKNSVDMIFTDPPYGEEYIPLYEDLARLGARVLKPGGSLITYVGHYAVGEIYKLMENYLRFWWLISVKHSGGAARLIGKNVFVEWKPLLWFVKDHRRNDVEWVADMVESDVPTKDEHDWQQGYQEADYYIDKLTLPGDLVVDPFAGSGTTLISAYKLKRKAIGIEIDSERVSVARVHIQTECGLPTA